MWSPTYWLTRCYIISKCLAIYCIIVESLSTSTQHEKAIIYKMSYGWCNSPTKPWNIYAIPTKGIIGTTFNDNLSMKFYTCKKKP